jgi:hypothetical protein
MVLHDMRVNVSSHTQSNQSIEQWREEIRKTIFDNIYSVEHTSSVSSSNDDHHQNDDSVKKGKAEYLLS